MNTQKKSSGLLKFQRDYPIISTIVTSIISIFLGYLLTYAIDIKPSIENIDDNNIMILKKQDSCCAILSEINDKYTIQCESGEEIKVGYSSETQDDLIKVVKSDKFDLKRGDEIYLTNICTKYQPSIKLMVEEIVESTKKDKNEIKIYISKDAVKQLGLEKDIYRGVFTLKMKRIIK